MDEGTQGAPTALGQQMRDLGAEAPADPEGGALEAAAAGESITGADVNVLRDYFLGNGTRPGDAVVKDVQVKLPDGARWALQIKAISYGEWQDAQERGTDDESGKQDAFVTASWIVARAVVTPKLGPIVNQLREQRGETAPRDASGLLREFFLRQPGGLLGLSQRVINMSGLGLSSELVVEVEAGKG